VMPLPPMPPPSMPARPPPAPALMSLFDLSGGLFDDEDDDESL